MIERLFYSAFLTASLWGIVHLSKLPESSSQKMEQLLNTGDRVAVLASCLNH
jgi:hypothetical protein